MKILNTIYDIEEPRIQDKIQHFLASILFADSYNFISRAYSFENSKKDY